MTRVRPALLLATIALAGSLAAVLPASAAMKVRLAKPKVSVTIPDSTAVGTYFEESQRSSTLCRADERALAPGIVDAPRHFVGQSFGPSAVGAWATGAKGKVKLRLQLLCARGSNIVHKRKPGKTRPAGSSMTTTAKVSCGGKRVAIGAPLSQEFSPGFGRFISKPKGVSGWQVTVEGIPTSFPLESTVPAYADVACVPKSSLKSVETVDGSTGGLQGARTAKLRVACKGGRRPVGWGVDLRPFTSSLYSRADDGWALPIVRKAAFDGKGVAFQFDLPPGGVVGAADVTQTGYVVCAKLA